MQTDQEILDDCRMTPLEESSEGVRVEHLPTGLYAECDSQETQYANKDDAEYAVIQAVRENYVRELQNQSYSFAHHSTVVAVAIAVGDELGVEITDTGDYIEDIVGAIRKRLQEDNNATQ